ARAVATSRLCAPFAHIGNVRNLHGQPSTVGDVRPDQGLLKIMVAWDDARGDTPDCQSLPRSPIAHGSRGV
ncbi:hypothetical protein ACWIF8_31045, partial [Micromonospora chalcea]